MMLYAEYYYHIRIAVFIILISAFLYKLKILPHAKSLIGILTMGIICTLFKLFHSETYLYYSFTVKSLLFCSLTISCIGSYSINALLPGWFNVKRLFELFAFPIVIFLLLFISKLFKVDFYLYESLNDCLSDINEYQVWVRFLILALLWIQFLLEVFLPRLFIKHFKPPIWYDIYSLFFLVYVIAFAQTVFKNSLLSDMFISLYVTLGVVALSILELFTHLLDPKRIKVTNHINEDYKNFIDNVDVDNMDYLQKNTNQFYKIEKIIMDEKLYVNPDFTLEDLSFIIHLTTRELEQAILTAGYASFNHFIAKCRIVALKKLLLQNNGKNILNLYNQVGFNNRVSATKYFKLFTNTTPTEWVKQEKKYLFSDNSFT